MLPFRLINTELLGDLGELFPNVIPFLAEGKRLRMGVPRATFFRHRRAPGIRIVRVIRRGRTGGARRVRRTGNRHRLIRSAWLSYRHRRKKVPLAGYKPRPDKSINQNQRRRTVHKERKAADDCSLPMALAARCATSLGLPLSGTLSTIISARHCCRGVLLAAS
jgi:hypothetical protein